MYRFSIFSPKKISNFSKGARGWEEIPVVCEVYSLGLLFFVKQHFLVFFHFFPLKNVEMKILSMWVNFSATSGVGDFYQEAKETFKRQMECI